MSRDDTALELQKLRAEVAALSDAHREAAPEQVDVEIAAGATSAAETVDATEPDVAAEVEASQLEELGTLLEAQIKDLPTITTLAVFSLGILMGRLMR